MTDHCNCLSNAASISCLTAREISLGIMPIVSCVLVAIEPFASKRGGGEYEFES